MCMFLGTKEQRSTLVFTSSLTHHSHYTKLAVKLNRSNRQNSSLDPYVYNIFWYVFQNKS